MEVKFTVNGQKVTGPSEWATTGFHAMDIVFEFDESWENFTKVAVIDHAAWAYPWYVVLEEDKIDHNILPELSAGEYSVGVVGVEAEPVDLTIIPEEGSMDAEEYLTAVFGEGVTASVSTAFCPFQMISGAMSTRPPEEPDAYDSMVDAVVSAKNAVEACEAAVSDEASARECADNGLQDAIDAEEAARADADDAHKTASVLDHPDGSVTEAKLETSLNGKINESYDTGVSNTERIATVESGKADKSDTYTKSETYTKTEANTLLGGKADLENGKVPASQLPAFVDDVLEGTYVDATEFDDKNGSPYKPEGGKLYVDVSPNSPYFNRTYRWSGSQYSEVSESLALGETSSTAYAGDKGKQNADDIASLKTRMTTAEGDVSDIKDNVSELQDDVYGEETPTTQSYEFTVNQTLDNKGEIVQVPGNHTTEEIAIPPTATGMTYSGTIYYNRAGVIFYDENGGWVSSDAIGSNPPVTYTNKSITIPAEAKIVVAQCRDQELESAQFSISFTARSGGLQDDVADLKSGKADKDTTYTKTQVDTALGQKAEKSGLQAEITNRTNADKAINFRIDTVEKIAKGANQAVSFDSYSALVTSLNTEADTKYRAGQNLMVITLDVPDLWVSGVSQTSVPYPFVDDETFIEDMADTTSYGVAGKIQVGYYILSQLETQKVNLDDYYNKAQVDERISIASPIIEAIPRHHSNIYCMTKSDKVMKTIVWSDSTDASRYRRLRFSAKVHGQMPYEDHSFIIQRRSFGGGDGETLMKLGSDGAGNTKVYCGSSTVILTDGWHSYALEWDQVTGAYRLYIDGTEAAGGTKSGLIAERGHGIQIGGDYNQPVGKSDSLAFDWFYLDEGDGEGSWEQKTAYTFDNLPIGDTEVWYKNDSSTGNSRKIALDNDAELYLKITDASGEHMTGNIRGTAGKHGGVVNGSYVGNGTTQDIILGFRPAAVVFHTKQSGFITSSYWVTEDNVICELTDTGFTVKIGAAPYATNANGTTYWYTAMEGAE